MPSFDVHALLKEFDVYARAACALRATDADQRDAHVEAQKGDLAASLVNTLIERMPAFRAARSAQQLDYTRTALADISAFLEGTPAGHDHQGNVVVAAVAGCEDGVGHAARARFKREWEAYKREVRACVFDNPRFGFAAHEPDGIMVATEWTERVFQQATLANLTSNPLWLECRGAVQSPPFLCSLFLAAVRASARSSVAVSRADAIHAKQDNAHAHARITAALKAVHAAAAALLTRHTEISRLHTSDSAWATRLQTDLDVTGTVARAEVLQAKLVESATNTHHKTWMDQATNAYTAEMIKFVSRAHALVPTDQAVLAPEFARGWSALLSEVDTLRDTARLSRAAGLTLETPEGVKERLAYLRSRAVARGCALAMPFAQRVYDVAYQAHADCAPGLPLLQLTCRRSGGEMCDLAVQMRNVAEADLSLLQRLQRETAVDPPTALWRARAEALGGESLAHDQHTIMRIGADLYAEVQQRRQANGRKRLRDHLEVWLTRLGAPGFCLPPQSGAHILLATDARLVRESQLGETVLAPATQAYPTPTTFASLVAAYTDAARTLVEPAQAGLEQALRRTAPAAQAAPVWLLESKTMYADWLVDELNWARMKPLLAGALASLNTDAAPQVANLLAGLHAPTFAQAADAMLHLVRLGLVA